MEGSKNGLKMRFFFERSIPTMVHWWGEDPRFSLANILLRLFVLIRVSRASAACLSFRSSLYSRYMQVPPSRILTQCPLCHAQYEQDTIRLLGEEGITRLVHCTCSKCGRAMIAVILEASGFVSSVGVVTDLEVEDAVRFQDAQPLQADECIQFAEEINAHSQRLCRALQAK